jgi:hypothetical protein
MKTVTLSFRDNVSVINVIRTLQTEIDMRNALQQKSFKNSTESTIRDLQETIDQLYISNIRRIPE